MYNSMFILVNCCHLEANKIKNYLSISFGTRYVTNVLFLQS